MSSNEESDNNDLPILTVKQKEESAINEFCSIIKEEKSNIQKVFREHLSSLTDNIFTKINSQYSKDVSGLISQTILKEMSKTIINNYFTQYALVRDMIFKQYVGELLSSAIQKLDYIKKNMEIFVHNDGTRILNNFILELKNSETLYNINTSKSLSQRGGDYVSSLIGGTIRSGKKTLKKYPYLENNYRITKRKYGGEPEDNEDNKKEDEDDDEEPTEENNSSSENDSEPEKIVPEELSSLFQFSPEDKEENVSTIMSFFRGNTSKNVVNRKILYIIQKTIQKSINTKEFKQLIRQDITSKAGDKISSILNAVSQDDTIRYLNTQLLLGILVNKNTHNIHILLKNTIRKSLHEIKEQSRTHARPNNFNDIIVNKIRDNVKIAFTPTLKSSRLQII